MTDFLIYIEPSPKEKDGEEKISNNPQQHLLQAQLAFAHLLSILEDAPALIVPETLPYLTTPPPPPFGDNMWVDVHILSHMTGRK